ncbi:hypothetical protein [Caballeronia sp. 15711]|uniref:hypothetical protein n=1 Tax=Caballeronia sp. 15711 TaxID=3391029 RepID=UPI0039E70D6B
MRTALHDAALFSVSLEVREITTFSSDRNLTASVAAKLYKGNAALGATSDNEEENIYLVKAQFGSPSRAPATQGLEPSVQRVDSPGEPLIGIPSLN